MSEKKIKVPDGMLKAAISAEVSSAQNNTEWMRIGLEAALRWLSQNPIAPTDEQGLALFDFLRPTGVKDWNQSLWCGFVAQTAVEWQRRMFLAPEPEPEIKDLLWSANPFPNTGAQYRHDEAVLEAFNRGRRLGGK